MPRPSSSPRFSSWAVCAALASAALLLGALLAAAANSRTMGSGLDAATDAKIDALVGAEISAKRAPGISIAIARGDDLLFARGYGEADLAKRIPVEPQMTFAIGSVAKQFTAAAILLLQRDGKLSIDDPLGRYVPELRGAQRITLRDVLNQRSGVPDYTKVPGLDPVKGMGWNDFINAVNRLTPEFEPSSAFRYNNLNYLLLGKVIERVAGESYARFVEQRIADPLGLSATATLEDAHPQATGYTLTGGSFQPAAPWDPSLLGGAGAIVANALDLARWDDALFGGRVLPQEWLAEMERPASESGYAMGWVVERRGDERLLWHNGEIGGFHAMNAVLLPRRLAVVVLINADDLHGPATSPEGLARQIIGLLEPGSAFGEAARAQQQAVPADAALVMRVRSWIAQFASNHVDRSQLTPEMNAALTPSALAQTAAAWAPLGEPTGIGVLGHDRRNGVDAYVLRVDFARGPFIWKIAVTADGKLAGAGGLEPSP